MSLVFLLASSDASCSPCGQEAQPQHAHHHTRVRSRRHLREISQYHLREISAMSSQIRSQPCGSVRESESARERAREESDA